MAENEMYPRSSAMAKGQGEMGSSAYAELIGDIKDPQKRVERILEWFTYGTEESAEKRDVIVENFRFMSNKQYTDAEQAYLRDQGRPPITINFSTGIVLTISGLQRLRRTETRLAPFDPSDQDSAALMEVLVKHIEEKNGRKQKDSRVFVNKEGVGLGFWKLCYDFKRRPQGDIKIESLNPLSVIWDPNYPDCEWEDTEWVMHTEYYTMARAIARFPKYENEIRAKFGEWLRPSGGDGEQIGDSQTTKRTFWDSQTQRAQILEVWYKDLVEVDVAVFADGEVESDPDKVSAIEEALKGSPDAEGVVITKRPVQKVYVSYVLDDLELDHLESPYPFDELPIVPSLGIHFHGDFIGNMDLMKSAQQEKNKRRMGIAEVAGRSARSGIIADKGVFDRADVENYFNGAGVYLEKNAAGDYDMIQPPALDQNLMTLERWASEEIMLTVALNKEALGQSDAATQSGKAFDSKSRTGVLSQEHFFDTFADDQAVVTRLLIKMIQDRMTLPEAMRILGRFAMENPEEPQTALIAQDGGLRVQEILSRTFNIDYDVIVTSKPYEPNVQLSKFNQLVELRRNGMQVPDPILVKAAIEANVIDKKLGLDWLQMVTPALQGPMGAAGGTGLPTTPDGVDAQMAQQ